MQLFSVLKKDLRLLVKDRGQLIVLFLMPLAFILPISIGMSENFYNLGEDAKRPLPVVNYDLVDGAAGEYSRDLFEQLAAGFQIETDFTTGPAADIAVDDLSNCGTPGPACEEQIAAKLVETDRREAALVIPADFSPSIAAGERVTVTLLYEPANDAIERQIFAQVVNGASIQLSLQNQVFSGFEQFQDLLTLASDQVQTDVEESITAQRDEVASGAQAAALSVVSVAPANYTLDVTPNNYQQTIPGYTVMFVFFLISYLSGALKAERNIGTFRRLLHLPVSPGVVLGGKVLAAFVIGLAQVAVLFFVGSIGFGLTLGRSPLALLLLTAALVLAAVGIGLAAATFRLENVLSVPLIVAALIGGCLFPASWLPPFVRSIGVLVPHTWAMLGYQDLLVRGQGLMETLPEIGALLLFAVVFFTLAVRRFEFA